MNEKRIVKAIISHLNCYGRLTSGFKIITTDAASQLLGSFTFVITSHHLQAPLKI